MPRISRPFARAAGLAALAALPVLAACSDDDATGPTPVPVALALTADRTTIAPGDTVSVRLVARNTSGAPLVLHSGDRCLLSVVLRSAPLYSNIVLRAPGGAARTCESGTDVTLAAGDSVVERGVVAFFTRTGVTDVAPAHAGDYLLLPVLVDGPRVRRAAGSTPLALTVR